MKSILQSEKQCFICATTKNIHCHHVYGGANRKNSDKNGFTVYLCAWHHNIGGGESIHENSKMSLWLKQACQKKYEETHSREEFIRIIGRNYL